MTLQKQRWNGLALGIFNLPVLPVFFLILQGCFGSSDGLVFTATQNSSTDAAPSGILSISSASQTVSQGGTIQFTAAGGTPPYSFSVTGGGAITADSGLYTAPIADATAIVAVQDTLGTNATAVVTVGLGAAGGGDASPTSQSSVIQTSYSVLQTLQSGCTSSAPFGDVCNSAINAFCGSQGFATGYGPVEYNGDTSIVVCIQASGASILPTNMGILEAYQSDCSSESALMSGACYAATNRYCQAQGFAAGGFGPTDHSNGSVYVGCVLASAGLLVTDTFSSLVGYVASCTAANAATSSCNSAIHRSCQAKGYSSGYGILENSGDMATYACLH